MRTIYLISGNVAASTSDKDFKSNGIGAGLLLDETGRTVGFDLFCEIQPNKWVRADELPSGLLAEEKRRGTLIAGVLVEGKVYNRLNVNDISDKLIASRIGLEQYANEYRGEPATFKAQASESTAAIWRQLEALERQIEQQGQTDQWEELTKRVEALGRGIKNLHILDKELRDSQRAALKARLLSIEKKIAELRAEEPNEFDWFVNLASSK